MSTIDDIESLMKSMRLGGSEAEAGLDYKPSLEAEAGLDYKPSLEAEAGLDYKRLYLEKCDEVIELRSKLEGLEQKVSTLSDARKNKGEKDEIMVCHALRDISQGSAAAAIELYGEEAKEGISVLNPTTMKAMLPSDTICKTPCGYKADVCVKMNSTGAIYASSVKSTKGAPPAILNHTPRSAKVFSPQGELHRETQNLDKIITEYLEGRKEGRFKEDVHVKNMEWIKDDSLRSSFVECLRYFVFNGTGSGKSKCEANSILLSDEKGMRFVKCHTRESKIAYVETILDKCVISIRSKGSPANLVPNTEKYDSCMRWGYMDTNGLLKCALHIRTTAK
jgi:hypothetical protein